MSTLVNDVKETANISNRFIHFLEKYMRNECKLDIRLDWPIPFLVSLNVTPHLPDPQRISF